MKLKQSGLKLGLAMAVAGLLSAQAHAADGFDGAVEPMALGAALPLAGAEAQAAAPEQQVGSAAPLPITAAAASGSGPLEVEGSAALAAFSQADIATLFEPSAAPLQLAALSEQEMRETEGAVWNFVFGGLTGFGMHAIQHRHNMTWRSAAIATGTGALTGGVGGALIRASGGGLVGNLAWRPNIFAANAGFGIVNNPSRNR